MTLIVVILLVLGVGVFLLAIAQILRLGLRNMSQLQDKQLSIISQLERLGQPKHDPEPKPDPRPKQQKPKLAELPVVVGLSEEMIWEILLYVAGEGGGRLSRRNVEKAGYGRNEYELLREALKKQGYLKEFSRERQSPAWTSKGRNLLLGIKVRRKLGKNWESTRED